MSNREVSFMCIQSAAAAAAAGAAALSVAILLLLLQQQCCCFLILYVIVCRIAKFVAGSLNLIPVLFFSSFKRDLFLMYPLAVPSHLRLRFAFRYYMLGNYGQPRRASAHRGEALLGYTGIYTWYHPVPQYVRFCILIFNPNDPYISVRTCTRYGLWYGYDDMAVKERALKYTGRLFCDRHTQRV